MWQIVVEIRFLKTKINKKLINLMFVDPFIIVKFTQKNPTRCNGVSKFIIPYLYEAQHVSGDTPPITLSASSNLNVQQPSTVI